ncbi:LINE-1 retrotransposable element ORF1 protein [Dissostichus eleginoides]|nr:LINE-1 retrotransposable element ORF1 protein [Dissostichus eleginoides]
MDVKEALIQALKQQRVLQNRLTDQEGRNRRNNIRIFGLTEGAEGTSATQFIERLLTTELSLPAESDLQIQRVHRSLMPRPASDKPPRSIVVNFLQYTTKEMVLMEAWKKRIQFQGRALFFDHDPATEILQKRKEVHWESGPRTYESAQQAADELNRRGIQIETPRGSVPGMEERLQKTLLWQRVGNSEDTAMRAKQKLQGFQRE